VAAALAVFLALTSDYDEHHNEHGASISACGRDACSSLVTNATAASHHEESPVSRRAQNDDGQRQPVLDANGNIAGFVTSRKTGARARVGVAYAARFQAYIDDLETNHGANILFMGGIRPGRCLISSLHPCGKALDVCQLRRGVVDPRCHLPGRAALAGIAAAHGLFEGGRWCNSDYGHAQVGLTAGDCGDRRTRIAQK
jgi:hypothetical protein